MEPLRDPNPSDILEVRTAFPYLEPSRSRNAAQCSLWGWWHLIQHKPWLQLLGWGEGEEPTLGLCQGCETRIWCREAAFIRICCYRTWTTASFPSGTRSWSWMKNEGKGGSKEGDAGLGVPSTADTLWGAGLGCSGDGN